MTDLNSSPSTDPTASIVKITPELAGQWLSRCNTHNRNMRGTVVNGYARDMANGRWAFTGDSIKFSRSDELLDGQHRLKAIIVAGVTLPMLVVRGLPNAAQDAMDTGVKRTAADALTLDGEKKSITLAAAAKMAITDVGRSDRYVSTGEIKEFLTKEPFLKTICADIVPALHIRDVTSVIVTYTYWRLDKVAPDHVAGFYGAWSTLAGLPADSPILAMHRRFQNISRISGSTRGRHYRQEAVAYIMMSWNAWARCEPRAIVKLAYGAGGRLSIPEPVVPRLPLQMMSMRETAMESA